MSSTPSTIYTYFGGPFKDTSAEGINLLTLDYAYFGGPFAPNNLEIGSTIIPFGVGSAEAFGTPLISMFIVPNGIGTAEAVGTPSIYAVSITSTVILPVAIDSAEVFGTPLISMFIVPDGISTSEAFGTPSIYSVSFSSITPTAIDSEEVFGVPEIIMFPPTVCRGRLVNAPLISHRRLTVRGFFCNQVTTIISPAAIGSAEAFGEPEITEAGGDGYIASGSVGGGETPTLTFPDITLGTNEMLLVFAGWQQGNSLDSATFDGNTMSGDNVAGDGDGTPGGGIYSYFNAGGPITGSIVLTASGIGFDDYGFIAAAKIVTGGYNTVDATGNGTGAGATASGFIETGQNDTYIQTLAILRIGSPEGVWTGFTRTGATGGTGGVPSPPRLGTGDTIGAVPDTYSLGISGLDDEEGTKILFVSYFVV